MAVNKIIKKIFQLFLSLVSKENKEEAYKEQLNTIFIYLFARPLTNTVETEREIYKTMFDAKYAGTTDGTSPYDILTTFYEKAAKGDTSFMTHPFYRLLRRSNDKEVRRLKYRVKRS